MTGQGHLWVGVITGAAVTLFTHEQLAMNTPTAVGLGVAVLGALMPDIDSKSSIIAKKLAMNIKFLRRFILTLVGLGIGYYGWFEMHQLWAVLLGLFIGFMPWTAHRTWTHTLWTTMLWAYICYGAEHYYNIKGLMTYGTAGYLSHLIADSLTVAGVKWLYPLDIKVGIPLFRVGSFWGSKMEWAVIIGYAVLVALYGFGVV